MDEKLSNNTHHYDTKLKYTYRKLRELDDKMLVHAASLDICLSEIKTLGDELLDGRDKKKLDKVLDLFRSGGKSNYDDKNEIDAKDLICRVWRFVRKYEDKSFFLEQLIDILSGKCAQGRTMRLIQFYTPHLTTNDDPIYEQCLKQ